ncbi:MAG: TrkH family potassium uptake protein [Coriobacteriales bacterium]|nr:TrkH family potassium uptake protein [Coriobacteriales bacterium]MBQ6586264.1 TrkH family potassium uptake protein [Coriobacteriales bacterium]
MWPRFHLNDVRIVGHYLGSLVLIVGLSMLLPLLVALFMHEGSPAVDFLMGIGVCLIVGSLLRMLTPRAGKLNRRQALLVTGLSWIVIGLVASVPMLSSGAFDSPLDALFDGVSALTTTGMSLSHDYNHMAYSHMLWRVMLTFIGGSGVIVVALSLGVFGRSGGQGALYKTEARSDHVLPNMMLTARFIWGVSATVIVLGVLVFFLPFLIMGMDGGRALWNSLILSISSYDTGGIPIYTNSLVYYHSPVIEFICLVIALMGVVNPVLYAALFRGEKEPFFKNSELRTMAGWFTVMAILLCLVIIGDGAFTHYMELLRRGAFMVVSAGTTTGWMTVYTGQLGISISAGAMMLIALIMLIGGPSGSTAGGIKVGRLSIILKWFAATIRRAVRPKSNLDRVGYHQFTKAAIDPSTATQAMVVMLLFVITVVAGAMIAVVCGYDADAGLFESISCVTSAGISSGIVSPGMPVALKVFYILAMWAGRLEFIALLSVFASVVTSIYGHAKTRIEKLGDGL